MRVGSRISQLYNYITFRNLFLLPQVKFIKYCEHSVFVMLQMTVFDRNKNKPELYYYLNNTEANAQESQPIINCRINGLMKW